MDINTYDAQTQALIEKVYAQKQDMSEDAFVTLEQLKDIAYEKEDFALQGFVHFHIADTFYFFEKGWDAFRENLAKAVSFFLYFGRRRRAFSSCI